MISLLTPDDIFAHIVFLRTVDTRTILIVEGETDCAVLDAHVNRDDSETLPAGSKTAAIGAAMIAADQGERYVLALVDRDWVGTLHAEESRDNVFYTDSYDMESTLLGLSNVRTRILIAFASREKLQETTESDPKHPINVARKTGAALAGFRYSSIKNSWGIGVRDFPVEKAVNLDGGNPDLRLLCRIAAAKSKVELDVEHAIAEVAATFGWLESRADLHSGHDLVSALSYVLNNRFGASVKSESLASSLRAAAACEDVRDTRFFADMSRWAARVGRELWTCSMEAPRSGPAIPPPRQSVDVRTF